MFFLFVLIFIAFLDFYVFQGVKILTSGILIPNYRTWIHAAFWIINWGVLLLLIIGMMNYQKTHSFPMYAKWSMNFFLTFLVSKLVFILFIFSEDVFRLGSGVLQNLFSDSNRNAHFLPSRRAFFSQLGIAVAAIPFVAFVYGMTKGKYNFKLHKQILYFRDLPESFDGYIITQTSDIHSGSFDELDGVQKGVDMAMSHESDLYVFTGDLVNNLASEIEPYIDMFSKITANDGKYAVMGNHDYGDYIRWSSLDEKTNNLNQLALNHQKMGQKLLRDQHIKIEKNGESIYLLGVENWGVGFGERGNLGKALENVPKDAFKILLSHDPSHWEKEVKNNPTPIQLTLSGHTHGAQMGIEIPGFKWSPVKYRYPHWAGLKEENGRNLYINRGFGFLAFAGRVGIWPEITVIKLRRQV
ncbi:MAG: metallophosphoesterase [Bacteroidota bacterium]|nr:metallophosphoesterase [Bacteroidota bacterium]